MQVYLDIEGLGYNVKMPDILGSMFDEDLFIEAYGLSTITYPDGEYFDMIIDGVTASVIVWGGVARYYFDNLQFDDFTKATKKIIAEFGGVDYEFFLLPKKSIGEVTDLNVEILPFWSLKNTLSNIESMIVKKNVGGVKTSVTLGATRKNSMDNLDSYFIGSTAYYYNAARIPCDTDTYFEWIDDDGLWRSWYFGLKETKASSKGGFVDVVKNISASLNERNTKIDLKKNSISYIFSSGNEEREILTILNSIKSSSYVFMGETLERVNIKSEDTTTYKLMDEFIFTVTKETKTAL
jgi:hypothetical protein